EEVKLLAKKHRNREQFTRVKREAVTAVVGRGVSEREKLENLFKNRKDELSKQHESVREQFEEHRKKARTALNKEFETRLARVDVNSEEYTLSLEGVVQKAFIGHIEALIKSELAEMNDRSSDSYGYWMLNKKSS
ncbi:hypothetical protein GWI33_021180, partial [Rhynchophorus ferrugineus]